MRRWSFPLALAVAGCVSSAPPGSMTIRPPGRAAFSYLSRWSGTEAPEMVPFSPLPSLLADPSSGHRPHVIGLEIRAAELPIVRRGAPESAVSEERFALRLEPFGERSRPHAAEGKRRVARVAALPLSEVRVGTWIGSWIGGTLQPTAPLRCGAYPSRAAHAEGPNRIATTGNTPALEYVLVDGWFDAAGCSIRTLSVATVLAKEILPDLLYAFRTCTGDCSEGIDLCLVFPHASRVVTSHPSGEARSGFTRTTLPMRQGGAESVMASIEPTDVAGWTETLLPGLHLRQVPPATSLYLNVEVMQTADDAEPLAMAYVAAMR